MNKNKHKKVMKPIATLLVAILSVNLKQEGEVQKLTITVLLKEFRFFWSSEEKKQGFRLHYNNAVAVEKIWLENSEW